MKMQKFFICSVALGLGVIAVSCTAPPSFFPGECDPDAVFPAPECIPDGGADAGDAEAGPTEPDAGQSACPGRCVPVPSGNAGYWSEVAVSLLVYHTNAMAEPPTCPEGASAEKWRLFAELDAPAAACEPCECGPSTGACKALPEKFETRAGACGESGAASLPFDAPAGWDGSCTSENALPAGVQCGGEPCAQSVWVSPLPGPTNEGCSPKGETPAFTKTRAWKLAGLACMNNTDDDTCAPTDAGTRYCVSDPGPEFLQCVVREGTDAPCPDNYNWARYEMYPEDAVIDERDCEACACGPPEGSACTASVHLYEGPVCSSQSEQFGMVSPHDQCQNIGPPGHALAGKAITDLDYVPGTCAATGGAPKGEAKKDVTRAVTFCCLYPFYLIN